MLILSSFASLVLSVLYSYPSITAMALEASSTSTPTRNTTILNQITLLNNKGMSLYNLGKFNESITYFDKALAIDPKNVAALDNKG
jgi:tetratricopeptide (TPR) repeat protein